MQVRHNADEHRYEVVADGEVVGFTEYREREGRFWFVHTEIDPSQEGNGAGSLLVRGAMDDMASKDALVVPTCPFVAAWLRRHPDYQDLVDTETLREYKRRRSASHRPQSSAATAEPT